MGRSWRSNALCLCVAVTLLAPCLAQVEKLKVKKGFTVTKYADIPFARSLAHVKIGKSTIVYAGSRAGWGGSPSSVWCMVDTDSDGTVDYVHELLKGIDTPNGIALKGDDLYVSGFTSPGGVLKGMLWRLEKVHTAALDKKTYDAAKITVITDKLPGDYWHGWRYFTFDKEGKMILAIGFNCNVCLANTTAEGYQFGTIYRLDVDTPGKVEETKEIIATGVRNSVGLTFHPDSGELYFTDNGRDEMGNNRPDCELNRLTKDGQDFGFPFCLAGGTGNPWKRDLGAGTIINDPDMNKGGKVKNCKAEAAAGKYEQPLQAMGPHVAPLGLRFYQWSEGASFPKSYDRTLFVVQRGSWNRAKPIGQRVMTIRVDPKTGETSNYQPFLSGWLQPAQGGENPESWGRPADCEQLPDGSLLVSDDTSGALFRITWDGK